MQKAEQQKAEDVPLVNCPCNSVKLPVVAYRQNQRKRWKKPAKWERQLSRISVVLSAFCGRTMTDWSKCRSKRRMLADCCSLAAPQSGLLLQCSSLQYTGVHRSSWKQSSRRWEHAAPAELDAPTGAETEWATICHHVDGDI